MINDDLCLLWSVKSYKEFNIVGHWHRRVARPRVVMEPAGLNQVLLILQILKRRGSRSFCKLVGIHITAMNPKPGREFHPQDEPSARIPYKTIILATYPQYFSHVIVVTHTTSARRSVQAVLFAGFTIPCLVNFQAFGFI